MDKNRVKRLADNPYYSMNDKELEQLAEMLREEAKSAKEEETKEETKTPRRKVNKNRVMKTTPKLDKTPGLEEQEDVS
jgi:hypothetical protein